MHRFIIFFFSVLLLLLISGCADLSAPSLPYPTSERTSQWPPEDMDDEEIVDLSDIDTNIHEGSVTVEDMQNDEVYERMEFPENEYARLAKRGTSTIKGRIFLEDSYGGMVVKGKGTRLYLNPVTSYSKEWYVQSYAKGKIMTPADKRLFNYLRFTTSNDDGNFVFYGVPAGRYYVIGTIVCGDECGFDGVKNIRIASEVRVKPGGRVSIDLSKKL